MEPGLSHRPRFRQDLIAELIDDTADSGARFIDIMNPDSGHVFRLYEVEYSLACGMDGERDVSGIVKWAKDELGLAASTREVQSVIATLNDLNYLEPGLAIATPSVEPARAVVPVAQLETAPLARAGSKTRGEKVAPASSSTSAAERPSDRAATVPSFELGHAGPPPSVEDTPVGPAADIELASGILVAAPPQAAALPSVADIALGQSGRADTVNDLGTRGGGGADAKATARGPQPTPRADIPKEAMPIELPLSSHLSTPSTGMLRTPAEPGLSTQEERPTLPQPAPQLEQRSGRASDRPLQTEPAVVKASEPASSPAARLSEPTIEPTQPAPSENRRPAESARPRSDSWRGSRQLPPQRPVEPVEPRPHKEPPEEPRVSRAVLALLAAAIMGAVAFVTYKIAVKESDNQWEPPSVQVPAPSHTPEPLPVEVQKLTTSTELIEAIKPAVPAVIERIHETEVTRGQVIVEFAGHRRLAAEIAVLERDIEKRVQPEVEAAQRDRDAAEAARVPGKLAAAERRLADRQRSLADKQAKLATKKGELQKLEIRSPADGRAVALVAPGAKVKPTDEVAKLTHLATRIVTFKNAGGTPTTRVKLVSTASGRTFSCVVTKVDASGTTIACPLDVAPESTDVAFGGIDTTPPETGPEAPDNTQIEIDPVTPNSAGSGTSVDSGTGAPTSAVSPTPAPAPASAPAPSPAAPQTPPATDVVPSGSGETAPPPTTPPPTPAAPPKPAEPASETPGSPSPASSAQ